MKRFSFLVITLIISLFISSCSNNFQGNYVISESYKDNCVIHVQSQNNAIDFSSSSRSILPSALDCSSLHFYLWGQNKITGDALLVTEVTFVPSDNSTTGTIDFNFSDSSSYQLYLGATKALVTLDGINNSTNIANVQKELCYIGQATADLRYATEVLFILSPYDVTSGLGSVDLKLYSNWTVPAGYGINVGLYNTVTDQEIHMTKSAPGGFLNPTTVSSVAITQTEPLSPNYSVDCVKPGTYNLKISFIGTKKVFVYSDTIVVFANQTTAASLCVPNIIESVPNAAPSNFTIACSTPDSSTDDFYPVEFAWQDNSYNETYFQIELMDISNIQSPYFSDVDTVIDDTGAKTLSEKDTAWHNLTYSQSPIYNFNPNYYGDSSIGAFQEVCQEGSLCSNNNYIVLNLMLGRKFLARICATNYMGNTDYCYLDISNTGNYSIPTTTLPKVFTTLPTGSSSVNRYRIRYYLNNGRFYDNGVDVTNQIDLCKYGTENSTTSESVLNPINYNYDPSDISKKASLRYSTSFPWLQWTIDQIGGTPQALTYSGFENLNLFADYNTTTSNGLGNTPITNTFKVFAGNTASPDTTYELTITGDQFTVNQSTYKYIYLLAYNPSSSGTRDYSKVKANVSDKYGKLQNISSGGIISTGFTEYSYIVVDISDETKYQPDANLYFAEFVLSPAKALSEEVSYTLKFRIQ